MQYSLRRILVATAYVALAAAAFSQGTWYLAEILWAASLLALVFALLLAYYARGSRQAKALGFITASACFLVCLHFGGGNAVPIPLLLNVAGVSESTQFVYTSPSTPGYSGSGNPFQGGVRVQQLNQSALRAGNAVGVMAFGIMGVALGALAYRAAAKSTA